MKEKKAKGKWVITLLIHVQYLKRRRRGGFAQRVGFLTEEGLKAGWCRHWLARLFNTGGFQVEAYFLNLEMGDFNMSQLRGGEKEQLAQPLIFQQLL